MTTPLRDPLGDPYVVSRYWRRWAVYRIEDDSRHSTYDDEIDAVAACAKANAAHHARYAAKRRRAS